MEPRVTTKAKDDRRTLQADLPRAAIRQTEEGSQERAAAAHDALRKNEPILM